MGPTTLSTPHGEADLVRLDRLIAEVARSNESQTGLLIEHLQSARSNLLGAMPEEYEFSLTAAQEVAGDLSNATLREEVTRGVGQLRDHLAESRTQSQGTAPARREDNAEVDQDKSELYRFFHGSPTTLGVFYPTHYIFASFSSFANAQKAAQALRSAGYQELVAATAAETFRFMNEIRVDVGIWGALMASISRFFGTEEVFADIDLEKAEQGAGFLAIYCPKEEQAENIRDLVLPFEPEAMQLYLPGGVRSLIAGPSPGPQSDPEEN